MYIQTLADESTKLVTATEACWVQTREPDPVSTQSPKLAQPSKPGGKVHSQGKLFLKVPFAEKDKAKALGARWDATQKKWYVPSGVDATLFAAWLPDA